MLTPVNLVSWFAGFISERTRNGGVPHEPSSEGLKYRFTPTFKSMRNHPWILYSSTVLEAPFAVRSYWSMIKRGSYNKDVLPGTNISQASPVSICQRNPIHIRLSENISITHFERFRLFVYFFFVTILVSMIKVTAKSVLSVLGYKWNVNKV